MLHRSLFLEVVHLLEQATRDQPIPETREHWVEEDRITSTWAEDIDDDK